MSRLRSEEGSALLEFSLIVPLVVFMFLGVVDLGLVIAQSMTVSQAAESGASYGTLAGNGTDTAGMQAAATKTANGMSGFKVTATTWCSCTSAGSATGCSSSCPGSASPIQYVQVQTSAPASLIAKYPGLPTAIQLMGSSILRVQ